MKLQMGTAHADAARLSGQRSRGHGVPLRRQRLSDGCVNAPAAVLQPAVRYRVCYQTVWEDKTCVRYRCPAHGHEGVPLHRPASPCTSSKCGRKPTRSASRLGTLRGGAESTSAGPSTSSTCDPGLHGHEPVGRITKCRVQWTTYRPCTNSTFARSATTVMNRCAGISGTRVLDHANIRLRATPFAPSATPCRKPMWQEYQVP